MNIAKLFDPFSPLAFPRLWYHHHIIQGIGASQLDIESNLIPINSHMLSLSAVYLLDIWQIPNDAGNDEQMKADSRREYNSGIRGSLEKWKDSRILHSSEENLILFFQLAEFF